MRLLRPEAWFLTFAVIALPLLLRAQEAPKQTPSSSSSSDTPRTPPFPDGPLRLRWVTLGFRIPVFLKPEIGGGTVDASTSVTSRTFTTTGASSRVAPGAVIELPVYRRLTLVLEGSFHHVGYTQTRTDTDSASGSTITNTFTENTKANEFDFPAMLRFTGIRSEGVLSKLYVAGGASYRVITGVNTNNSITFTSPSLTNTITNTIPTTPAMNRVAGGVVGIGYRFLDDFNIRVTPEFRYTHWTGRGFNSFSTQSRQDQIEVGVALTF